MENPEVAQVFEEIADLLEIQSANPFRVRAYRNAARVVRDLSSPVAKLARDPEEPLENIGGIGKDLAGKIRTILDTGDLPLRQELRCQVPAITGNAEHAGTGTQESGSLEQRAGNHHD